MLSLSRRMSAQRTSSRSTQSLSRSLVLNAHVIKSSKAEDLRQAAHHRKQNGAIRSGQLDERNPKLSASLRDCAVVILER